MRFRKIRFLALGALLTGALPVRAQFGGGPAAAPPPIPGLAQIESAIPLTEAQRSQLAPLLQEATAAQDRFTAAQARLAQLQSTLRETLGPVLTDAQKEKLPMALFAARFGRGPRGGAPAAADQPSPRADANSLAAHQQLLAKRTQGSIDLYFMGDSITRRWGATDYPEFLVHWKDTFHGWNAANFGWGGDTLQNILWRLDHGELDGVNPKVIVFMGGTNNLSDRPGDDAQADAIARGIQAVVTRFQQKAPGATVILTGILPRGSDPQLHAWIRKINVSTAAAADGRKVRYLDLLPRYLDSAGQLNKEAFTADQLHLSLRGYQIWAEALTPLITELLGPKAHEDHAPPPTGDPSAPKQNTGGK